MLSASLVAARRSKKHRPIAIKAHKSRKKGNRFERKHYLITKKHHVIARKKTKALDFSAYLCYNRWVEKHFVKNEIFGMYHMFDHLRKLT